MKHLVLSIYDAKIEAYMRPFTSQTEGQALRVFSDELLREGSIIGAHPEDYALFVIGDFDDHSGELKSSPAPKCIARAHEMLAQDQGKQEN